MTKLKSYPEYKSSGIEWIGDVPVGWSVATFKRLLKVCNGQDYKLVEKTDGEYPVLGSGGEFARASSYMFNGESVLLGRKGTIDKPLYVNCAFWTVDTMFFSKIHPNAFPKFCYYIATTIPFSFYSTNTTIPSMTQEALSNHCIAFPPLPEQEVIADFLDRETAHIDTVITKKTRIIELLKEKRQATITHAVTKGLDPQAKMKDSGIEWIGEVPEGWAVKPLKYVLSEALQYGANEAGNTVEITFPRYIRITDLDEKGNLRDNSIKTLEPSKALPYMLQDGDILFARSGATVGKTFIYKNHHGSACYAGYLIRARPHRGLVLPDYLILAVRTHYYWEYISLINIQATIENVSAEKYANFMIPLPPLPEQQAIADYLDKRCNAIDTIITKTQCSIELLKEKRQALITAAVTGQIDVRSC